MPHPATQLLARWQRLRAADAAVLDVGADAERGIALVRLGVATALLAIPLHRIATAGLSPERYAGLAVGVAATLLAAVMYALARRDAPSRRIARVSGLVDVSMVSAALTAYLLLDSPHTAVNSRVVFEVYFIAIGATCLRYDWRACVATGLVAMAQYAAIVLYADAHWELNAARFAPFAHGMFSWAPQLSRLVLLAVATVLSTTVVLRAGALRRLSTRDRLTGVYNRGYFDERLAQELSRARRTGEPFAVAILDVDYFKRYNDSHGHLAGDAALRTVGSVLSEGVRASDVVARFGGEEFVLLLPSTSPEAAGAALDGLRRAIETLAVPIPRSATPGTLTASIGVGSWPVDGDDADAVIFEADRRLFLAKARGRNRVVGRIRAPVLAADPTAPPEDADADGAPG